MTAAAAPPRQAEDHGSSDRTSPCRRDPRTPPPRIHTAISQPPPPPPRPTHPRRARHSLVTRRAGGAGEGRCRNPRTTPAWEQRRQLSREAEVRRSFVATTVREACPRPHHKGATGRVRTGDYLSLAPSSPPIFSLFVSVFLSRSLSFSHFLRPSSPAPSLILSVSFPSPPPLPLLPP